jgi:DNA-binding GntR family transcriptional regulator
MRRHPEWRLLKEASINTERQQTYAIQHLAVVQAIAARDARGAEDAMRRHLISVRLDLLGIS